MVHVISRRQLLVGSMAGAASLASGSYGFAQGAKIKVAGVHASPVENAWNSRLHEAMLAAAKDGVIDYVFSEGVAGADYPRALREYADQGIQLIVGESYAAETEARQVAVDYPKTSFLMGSSSGPVAPNFGVFKTLNHEASYLAGMLAGTMSKTGTFGSVGAIPIPEVNNLINAFRSGVKETRPNAKFLVGFIGTFFDPPKAKEAALAQIDSGADILFGERIGTALSIGSLLDFTPRYPKTVFANAMWYFRPILDGALAEVKAGKPTGQDYSPFSMMKMGGNDIVFDAELVPAAAVGPMEAKRTAIKNGSFVVPVDNSEPT
jgi:basic membrane protein A